MVNLAAESFYDIGILFHNLLCTSVRNILIISINCYPHNTMFAIRILLNDQLFKTSSHCLKVDKRRQLGHTYNKGRETIILFKKG